MFCISAEFLGSQARTRITLRCDFTPEIGCKIRHLFQLAKFIFSPSQKPALNGGSRADGKSAEADAAHKDVGSVFGHADAGEAATGNLVGRKDGAAVDAHEAGNVHLDDTEVPHCI